VNPLVPFLFARTIGLRRSRVIPSRAHLASIFTTPLMPSVKRQRYGHRLQPAQSLTGLAVNVTLLSSPTFRPLPASQRIVSPGKTTFEKSVFSTFASVTW
jgi:hypothetical protein